MTDPELARRAAALAARSAARPKARPGPRAVPDGLTPVRSPRLTRRPHAAGASRILAAGLSATALFVLVTALGLAGASKTSAAPTAASPTQPVATATPAPKRIVVIIHRRHPAATAAGSVSSPAAAAPRPASPAPAAPSRRAAPVTTTKPS